MLIGGVVCWWPERRRKGIQVNSEMPGIPGMATPLSPPATTVKQVEKQVGLDDKEIVV
jgi:hypothetical protein